MEMDEGKEDEAVHGHYDRAVVVLGDEGDQHYLPGFCLQQEQHEVRKG